MRLFFIALLLFQRAQFSEVEQYITDVEILDSFDLMIDFFGRDSDLFPEARNGASIGSEMDLVEGQAVQEKHQEELEVRTDERDRKREDKEIDRNGGEKNDFEITGKLEKVHEMGIRRSRRIMKVPERFTDYEQKPPSVLVDEDEESEGESSQYEDEDESDEEEVASSGDDDSDYSRKSRFSIPKFRRKSSPKSEKKAFALKPTSYPRKAVNSYPHMDRSLLHKRIVAKFNAAKLGSPRSSIPWAKLSVEGWPDEVKSKNPRGWSARDKAILNECVGRLKFRWAEPNAESTATAQVALNTNLHERLVAQAKLLGLTHKTRDHLYWTRIFEKFPEFKLENRDYLNWTAADRENIQTNLMDKFFKDELHKSKKRYL